MDRRVTVRFFKVQRKARTTRGFGETLTKAGALLLAHRSREIMDTLLRLERLQKDSAAGSGLLLGEIVRIQMTNKPGMASAVTEQEPLNLPQGHGLAHSSVFAYDIDSSIMILQTSRNGISTSRIAGYFREISDGQSYSLLPILRQDALARLNRLTARRLRIKLAAPEDLSVVDSDQQTVKASLRHLKDLAGGPWIEVEVSTGREGESLKQRPTRKIMRWFQSEAAEGRGNIKILKVEGTESDDESEVALALDLLSEQLKIEEIIELPEDNPESSFNIRCGVIRGAFKDNHEYLSSFSDDGNE